MTEKTKRPPTKVSVRIADAVEELNQKSFAMTPQAEAHDAVAAAKADLESWVAEAKRTLGKLNDFAEDNRPALDRLEQLDLNTIRGRYRGDAADKIEPVRAKLHGRIESLRLSLSEARATLSDIPSRVASLGAEDVALAVFAADPPSRAIPRDGWYPLEPTRIKADIERLAGRAQALQEALIEIEGLIGQLNTLVARHTPGKRVPPRGLPDPSRAPRQRVADGGNTPVFDADAPLKKVRITLDDGGDD